MLVLIIILAFTFGLMAGINIEHLNHNQECLSAEAVYNKAVSNFREDLENGVDDSILFSDEYRKFKRYIDMQNACH